MSGAHPIASQVRAEKSGCNLIGLPPFSKFWWSPVSGRQSISPSTFEIGRNTVKSFIRLGMLRCYGHKRNGFAYGRPQWRKMMPRAENLPAISSIR